MTWSLLRNRADRRSTASGARPVRSRLHLLPLEDRVVPSTTLHVDDDLRQYPAAGFTSIQAAVDAAQAGDVIRVHPGSYDEIVTVDKTLTLIGSGPAAVLRTGNPRQEAVVQGVNTNPLGIINLQADDVVLRGFTVQANTDGPGVFTHPAFSGYLIEGNLVWRNNPVGNPVPNTPSGGLHLNSSGDRPTVVQGNAFKDHTAESFGDGVYTELVVHNARIEGNYFEGNVHYSIDLAGSESSTGFPGFEGPYPRSSNVVITDNTIERSGGVLVQYADDVEVSNNRIMHATRTGVYVGGRVNGVAVSNNTFSNAANVVADGIHFGRHTGIFVGTLDIPGEITGVLVSGNTIQGHLNGIWLAGDAADPGIGVVSGVTVENNTIRQSRQHGILLTGAIGNVIRGNVTDHNHLDGIHVDATSTGNTFSANSARHNGGFDVYDESTGDGTYGTANTWTDDNVFRTSYFAG